MTAKAIDLATELKFLRPFLLQMDTNGKDPISLANHDYILPLSFPSPKVP